MTLNVYLVNEDGTHTPITYHGSETLTKSSKEVLVFADSSKKQIMIWTGVEAPVRKKFVGSRVAQGLRFEIGTVVGTQSIEQGDEPQVFWNFAQIDPNEVTLSKNIIQPKEHPEQKLIQTTVSTIRKPIASAQIKKKKPFSSSSTSSNYSTINKQSNSSSDSLSISKDQMDILADNIANKMEKKLRNLLIEAGLIK